MTFKKHFNKSIDLSFEVKAVIMKVSVTSLGLIDNWRIECALLVL